MQVSVYKLIQLPDNFVPSGKLLAYILSLQTLSEQ